MSYLSDFERSFSHHTLRLVEEYSGEFGAIPNFVYLDFARRG